MPQGSYQPQRLLPVGVVKQARDEDIARQQKKNCMDSEKVQDPLKPLDEICEPDVRQKLFRGAGLDRDHEELSRIILSKKVPVDVRQLFATAKNLSLYSWFVYRFHQVSEFAAYSALEMALRLRYEKEKGKKTNASLGKLLEYAQKENWIHNEGFSCLDEIAQRNAEHKKSLEAILSKDPDSDEPIPVDPPTEQEIQEARNELDMVSGIMEAVPRSRNELAHGSSNLHPNSIAILEVVAEVINQIYE